VHFVTRLSLRLGAVVFLAVVLLFGVGIFAATQVQQDLLPNISVPALLVITPDPGASPQIVDVQVTVPVVNAMEGVAGTDTVQSTSSQGASLVIVLFRDGTDLKSAQQDASSALAGIRSLLPPQASSSSVQTFSTNSLPILEYAISADEPLSDLAGQLQSLAVPKLRGLAGISSVVLSGAPTNEVDVTLDPTKLAAHGVSVTQVASALQQASVVESVGSLKQGSATIPLQISGSLTSLDQIGKVTVTPPSNPAAGGRPPPNAPNSAERKSSACAEGATVSAHSAATPNAAGLTDLLNILASPTRFPSVSTATTSKDSSPDGRWTPSSPRDAAAPPSAGPGSLLVLPGAARSSAAPRPWCRHRRG